MEYTAAKAITALACLGIYLIVIIYFGFFSKQAKIEKPDSIEEFAVGDRKINWIVIMFMLIGLQFTAALYLSWFAWGAAEGMIIQYILVYMVFSFVTYYILSKRVWIFGRRFNLLTQPDYIQARYNCMPLTWILAVITILVELPWCIMEFAAMGTVISALTYGLVPIKVGVLIVGIVVSAYVIYGGMKSIAITELIQGILSSLLVAGMVIFAVYKLFGGWGQMFQDVYATHPENLTISFGGVYDYKFWASLAITASVGQMGYASFFTRIYTGKSVLETKRDCFWGSAVSMITLLVLVVSVGCVLIPEISGAPDEMALLYMADTAFGPVFLGLMGVVLLAAGMSMVSVISSAHSIIVSENFIKPFKKNMTETDRVKYARWCLLVYSLITVGGALLDLPNLYNIAMVLYEGVCQLVPLIVISLYWKRSNKYSATASLVLGFGTAVVLAITGTTSGWSAGIYGLVVNLIVHFVVGFITKKDDHVDELFDMVEEYEAAMLGEDKDGNPVEQTIEP